MGNSAKRFGNTVLNGIDRAVNPIVSVGGKIRSGVRDAFNVAKSIPVMGDLVEEATNIPIPQAGGMSLNTMGKQFDKTVGTLGTVNDLAHGKSVSRDQVNDLLSAPMNRIRISRGLPPK
jgi:hypothetical protein